MSAGVILFVAFAACLVIGVPVLPFLWEWLPFAP